MSGNGWKTFSNDFWGDVPRLLCRWETPQLGAFGSREMFFFFNLLFILVVILTLPSFLFCSERAS